MHCRVENMSIQIEKGKTKRDWQKLAGGAAEVAVKSLTLGHDGFGAVLPPLFRIFESLRGNDSTERRATRLVSETLTFATIKSICLLELARKPLESELRRVVEHILQRALTLAEQQEILLHPSHLENPPTFRLFQDAGKQLFYELKQNGPGCSEGELLATFQNCLVEGLNRIRTRCPDYYSPVLEALSGPDARADERRTAWQKYRELLVRRFEDQPLFGEEGSTGVRMGQVYQRLRGWWEEEPTSESTSTKRSRHLDMLDESVLSWLNKDDNADRIRLVSGGPGSGKSTFARSLAASLSLLANWRVVFVPLQRLRGGGPLERRIDEYFRLHGDEPFNSDTLPLASVDIDGHRDWLIIFDGLDELAKEGSHSESTAQEFASALSDWRARIGQSRVRFLVLGRAPSMQEARRRLDLHGPGTIHVAGMAPLTQDPHSNSKIVWNDRDQLAALDQRGQFWSRWAVAKNLPPDPPQAMMAHELRDLTNEPLLAYLLIFSGYAGEKWREAANNRNHIYKAIFDQIWSREKTKQTRLHLNDLGQRGFESLLQALGIAAWRGGGRTGDEATFVSVRNVFVKPSLLSLADACGAADLSNVALLFYTRKDEEGGRGYEFLHKSFGEYLTACGLCQVFIRWANQVDDPASDFSSAEFLKRWLLLTGPAPLTREIQAFLRNEVWLAVAETTEESTSHAARRLVRIGAKLFDVALREGLPAHQLGISWREAEQQERNAEEALLGVIDSLARVAFPMNAFSQLPNNGGWGPGPVEIPEFKRAGVFASFVRRMSNDVFGWSAAANFFVLMPSSPIYSMFSRLNLQRVDFSGLQLCQADFEGGDLEGSVFVGACLSEVKFAGANLRGATFEYAHLDDVDFTGTDVTDMSVDTADLDKKSRESLKTSKGSRASRNVHPPSRTIRYGRK